MQQQNEEIPRVVSRHLMKLSPEECNVLCKSSSSVQILSSRHIILKANDKIYKIIYSLHEINAFYLYYRRVEGRHCNFIIHPKIEREGSTFVYTYQFLPYSPLDVTNAKKCLRSLVQGIKTALDELHALQLSHNDIRLPNICFNRSFEVVFIDFDRCHEIEKLQPMFLSSGPKSCMYNIMEVSQQLTRGSQTDYFQLGWLVAWIMDNSGGYYHDRKWSSQVKSIQNNRFIAGLVIEGQYLHTS